MISHAPASIKQQQNSAWCIVEFKALDVRSLSLDHDLIWLNFLTNWPRRSLTANVRTCVEWLLV